MQLKAKAKAEEEAAAAAHATKDAQACAHDTQSELMAASLSISSAMSTKQEQRANEMAEWLRARGLGELEETFSANQIDLQVHTLTL